MTKELINHNDFDLDATANSFVKKTLFNGALACGDIRSKHFDLSKAKQENHEALKALGVTSGLQMMLGAQMLAVHNLHKEIMIRANTTNFPDDAQYYADTAVNLSNTFVHQATLLSKLQDNSYLILTGE